MASSPLSSLGPNWPEVAQTSGSQKPFKGESRAPPTLNSRLSDLKGFLWSVTCSFQGRSPTGQRLLPASAAHHQDPSLIGGDVGKPMGLSLGFLN